MFWIKRDLTFTAILATMVPGVPAPFVALIPPAVAVGIGSIAAAVGAIGTVAGAVAEGIEANNGKKVPPIKPVQQVSKETPVANELAWQICKGD